MTLEMISHMWKVTGIIKGGPCDGNRYTIKDGFGRWIDADKFGKRYLKKQGRRYRKLKIEEYNPGDDDCDYNKNKTSQS